MYVYIYICTWYDSWDDLSGLGRPLRAGATSQGWGDSRGRLDRSNWWIWRFRAASESSEYDTGAVDGLLGSQDPRALTFVAAEALATPERPAALLTARGRLRSPDALELHEVSGGEVALRLPGRLRALRAVQRVELETRRLLRHLAGDLVAEQLQEL